MKITKFGTMPGGREIFAYTLFSDEATVDILSYGAVIQKFEAFGVDIVGGFDDLESYLNDPSHQGGVVGRVANRIENAQFVLGGKTFYLPKNNGRNCLHGGRGFDRHAWEVISYTDNEIELYYLSPDGEEGFPGFLDTYVKYTLSGTALTISYRSIPKNRPTPISLTNHAYFNLDGFGGTVHNHIAQIFADRYTESNEELLPTGNRPAVDGTVYDLREPKRIGDAISENFAGYDINYILSPKTYEDFADKKLGLGAVVSNKKLSLSVYTDQPCVQFYTAGGLDRAPTLKGGVPAIKLGAFCLETQVYPDAPNQPDFPQCTFKAGEEFKSRTVYKFGVK